MTSGNIKIIIENLRGKYNNGERLIFWYDDKGDFQEDLNEIGEELSAIDVIVYELKQNEQFRTKYMLEREHPKQKYLIYAPFSKPPVEDNCLEDIFLYSRRFNANLTAILMSDLGIASESVQMILDHYNSFFRAKERQESFKQLNLDVNPDEWNEQIIYTGILRTLTKTKSKSFEDVLLNVVHEGLEGNPFLPEFNKYEVEESFWILCKEEYGYEDDIPTLERLLTTFFVTYVSRNISGEIPQSWKNFRSYRSNEITVFLDKMKSNVRYSGDYENASEHVSKSLDVMSHLQNRDITDFLECDAFEDFDTLIVNRIVQKLLEDDHKTTINSQEIPTICENRKRKSFGKKFEAQYNLCIASYRLLSAIDYVASKSLSEMTEQYLVKDYLIDRSYRDFYDALFKTPEPDDFRKLRELVENIYVNEYLSKQLPAWNRVLNIEETMRGRNAQGNFFRNHIQGKDKTAVIISDAMRYDVGRELFDKLKENLKYDATLDHMYSTLPAYTQLGMASLLPHGNLEIQSNTFVLSDGMSTNGTEEREAVLRKSLPNSSCIQANEILTGRGSREVFRGTEAVYIYHNKIDKSGEGDAVDVFAACTDTIQEILSLIKKIYNASVYRVIITADHGFLYRRDGITESDKINLDRVGKDDIKNRRFIISKYEIESEGVVYKRLGEVLGNDDARILSWPIGPNVFKVQGGQNFVHGGASPQEMIIPLITLKIGRDRIESHPAKIALISTVSKVTSLVLNLDFIQQESVGDEVTSAIYRIYFEADDNNERISNEVNITADRTDSDPQKLTFREKFNFKSKKYSRDKKYWLIVINDKTKVEILRKEFMMDIAFSSGIGFD
jgi:uncharacterized protein (TIGR02687 family)